MGDLRIIPREEAEALLESARPGPYVAGEEQFRATARLLAAAPNLAHTVRHLHAEVARLRAIPRGCLDYRGGHSGRDLDIYHYGIGTVIAAMDHATTAPDFQSRVVEAIGHERRNAQARAALAGAVETLRSIARGEAGARAALEFLAWVDAAAGGAP